MLGFPKPLRTFGESQGCVNQGDMRIPLRKKAPTRMEGDIEAGALVKTIRYQ
jgi:hypothetical protein